MSNKMLAPTDKMIREVKRHYRGEIPGPKAKTSSAEYNDFFFLYDVEKEAKSFLKLAAPERILQASRRESSVLQRRFPYECAKIATEGTCPFIRAY